MWATQAVRLGYKWLVGNGALVRFWEDCWFGKCSSGHTILGFILFGQ